MGLDRRRLLGLGTSAAGLAALSACSGGNSDATPSSSASGATRSSSRASASAGRTRTSASPATSPEITAALDDVVGRYQGIQMSLAVRDEKGHQLYAYDSGLRTFEGSVVKIPIALTVLRTGKQNGARLTDEQESLLQRSVGDSDNWCTLELFQRLGGGASHSVPDHADTDSMPEAQQDKSVWPAAAEAVNQTYSLMGIHGTQVSATDGWGGDETSAGDQSLVAAALLQRPDWVYSDELDLLLSWMQPHDDSQTWGVGGMKTQAPEGHEVSGVHVKNGWINDDADVWSVNSEGFLTVDGTKYAVGLVSKGYSLKAKTDAEVWQTATTSLVSTYFQKALG